MTLASAALRQLIDELAELYEPTDPAGYPARAITVASALIEADSCSYNEFREAGLARHRIDPAGVGEFPDSAQLFRQHLPEHPVLRHYLATGDGSASRVSDFLSDRQFRALGLHRDFYRHAEVNYQLALIVPGPRGAQIGMALNREHADFTEDERELADLLRPHVAQAAAIGALLGEPPPTGAVQPGAPPLTERQAHVLQLVAAGYSDRLIGRALGISTRTVNTHLQHSYRALGVTSRTEALARLEAQPAQPRLAPGLTSIPRQRPAPG